jgi:hypothetical protein
MPIPSAKMLAHSLFQGALEQLHADPNAATTLSIHTPSTIPGLSAIRPISAKPTVFRKKVFVVPEAQSSLHIIEKDGTPHHFVWHANQKDIKRARHRGILPKHMTQSPLAQAISALGHYHQRVLYRIYERGIVSNKFREKKSLISMAQNILDALLPLERLPNTFVSIQEIQTHLDAVKTTLETLKNNLKLSKDLETFDSKAQENISDYIDSLIQAIEHIDPKTQRDSLLQPTGPNSLITFVKKWGMETVLKTQEINQNITYSRNAGSFMRGDLNNACEDALKALRDYMASPHDPILPIHQGIVAMEENPTAMVDFSSVTDHHDVTATLRSIAWIQADGKSLAKKIKDDEIKTTRFTKWMNNASNTYLPKRILASAAKITTGLLVGFCFDLPVGFLVSILTLGTIKMPSLAAWIGSKLHVDTGAPKDTLAEQYLKAIHVPEYSAGTRLGHMIGNLIRNAVIDIVKGTWETISNFKLKGWDRLVADFRAGHWGKKYGEPEVQIEVLDVLQTECEAKKTEITQLKEEIKIKQEAQWTNQSAAPANTPLQTTPPYHLDSGEWNDITNACFDGLKAFSDVFVHNVHAKHPFTGLVFTLSYLAGGLAILAPQYVAFLSKHYIAFSEAIAKALAHGSSSAAIASGFTQAKLFSAAIEGACHGKDSWLTVGTLSFENNPSDIVTYTTLATLLGYAIAYQVDIPWLSEEIQHEVTDVHVPVAGLAFAGAKVGVLLVDFLKTKHAPETAPTVPNETSPVESASLTDEQKLNLRRLELLYLLGTHQESLPYLSRRQKQDIICTARHVFKGQPQANTLIRSIAHLLDPEQPKSIALRTLTLVTDYIPLTLRCVLSVFSWSAQPWHELKDKVVKDVTRLGHMMSRLTNLMIGNVLRVCFRGIADVISNEIIARIDGWIHNNKHTVSKATYAVSAAVDTSYEKMRQVLSVPVDAARSASTCAQSVNQFGALFRLPTQAPSAQPASPQP